MQKLEQIENFGAFLDFLSNPEEYKALVKDVREASKDYKELVEKKRQIKDIDAWRAAEGSKIAKAYEELERKNEVHQKAVDALVGKVDAHKQSVQQSNNDIQERTSLLNDRESAVLILESQLKKVEKLKGEYEDKLVNIRDEKERLKTQAAQIAALAGGMK